MNILQLYPTTQSRNPPHKYYSIATYQPATQVLLDRYISTHHTSIKRSLHINPPHKYYSIVTFQPATLTRSLRVNDEFRRAQMERHIKIERYENILAIR